MRAGADTAPGRVIALIVLVLAAGAATRGYVPGVAHHPRRPAEAGPVEQLILAALLAASVVAVAVAVAQRARDQRAAPGSIGELSRTVGAHRGRPPWRVLLIGLAVLTAWLLAVWVLVRLGAAHRFSIPAGLPGTPGAAPASPTGSDDAAAIPLRPPSHGPAPLGYLLALTAGLLVLLAAMLVVARARRVPSAAPLIDAAPAAAPPLTTGETLARAAELGLTRIADRSREPREAIIACYAVMERHLADVPDAAPREFDTPTEVLARAVEHHALPAGNASRLVELFTEARFSPHLMTEAHRAEAVAILRLVLDELRART
ncbi:hypothetical protein AWC24_10650 [Mycolicibacter senuensis]|uniref:Protein-glutamine gamma-glutamyltransferase-like C-terminal domain-containing protein n=2 Tax=Mycolicibacter senuensis TaxID=386913 RepID=A0A7I9XI32_9MYCO|nr:hypothetical protein AWC24_10650 [Mycolicibacter senuensis]GFG69584.1 hypothetical protein MSEN_13040 [Mycolicibacter senuensis]